LKESFDSDSEHVALTGRHSWQTFMRQMREHKFRHGQDRQNMQ